MGLLGELDVGYEGKRIHDFELFLLNSSWDELLFAKMRKTVGGVDMGCRGRDHESGVEHQLVGVEMLFRYPINRYLILQTSY